MRNVIAINMPMRQNDRETGREMRDFSFRAAGDSLVKLGISRSFAGLNAIAAAETSPA
ncbi:MAG: hypothetical protein JSS02_12940 [Planctomycetes bacterium]|nr:hypothetical protein [Planctomycetota bacterium]